MSSTSFHISQQQPWPHLNWPKEKSEAITAALPSRPLMPQPMCAAWIMLTSLAPSPMPSVTAPAFFLTSLVTWGDECSTCWPGGCGAADVAAQCMLTAVRTLLVHLRNTKGYYNSYYYSTPW